MKLPLQLHKLVLLDKPTWLLHVVYGMSRRRFTLPRVRLLLLLFITISPALAQVDLGSIQLADKPQHDQAIGPFGIDLRQDMTRLNPNAAECPSLCLESSGRTETQQ